MESPIDGLVRLLDLEQLELNYFRGQSPSDRGGRIFGGQVLGQSLMACGRTVEPDRPVHSLQAYFLLGGDPSVPILFEVERIRDGRSFTTRRVRAVQHGEAIFAMTASFHAPEDGPSHAAPMPDVPGPEDITETEESRRWGRMGPVSQRYIGTPGQEQRMWMRAEGKLPDDQLLHYSVVAYSSDMGLVSTIAMRHSRDRRPNNFMMASLDHAMWFHRPFRADEWFLYTRSSPASAAARGLAHGHMYTRDGSLVVTIVQEGLIRPRRGVRGE